MDRFHAQDALRSSGREIIFSGEIFLRTRRCFVVVVDKAVVKVGGFQSQEYEYRFHLIHKCNSEFREDPTNSSNIVVIYDTTHTCKQLEKIYWRQRDLK